MSLSYASSRGGESGLSFSQVVLRGLAGDGGLYLPECYPDLSGELVGLRSLSYDRLAYRILSTLADDLPARDLAALTAATYRAEVFRYARPGSDPRLVAPVLPLRDDLFLLQLSNGPTLAFKDMAMQFLGALFEYLLARSGRRLNILGATSGDTGSAAEHALRGRRGISVFMLSPAGRMSPFQRAQMYSLDDPNIHNIAVRGVFDQAQDIVKAINADHEFKARYSLGAVNSINWARVAAQVVYYFAAWLQVSRDDGEEIDFAVPSGNFGNVLAGWIARRMGLPIGRLIVATNENDVLDEFFRTGRYRVRDAAHTYRTSSPSMDISKASNLERYVADLAGRDGARVAALWRAVEEEGGFTLSPAERERARQSGFVSGRSDHAARLATIAELYRSEGVLIDPHTADGLGVARRLRRPGVRTVALETAQAAKFAATIREALGFDPPLPEGFADPLGQPGHEREMAADVATVKRYIAEQLSDTD